MTQIHQPELVQIIGVQPDQYHVLGLPVLSVLVDGKLQLQVLGAQRVEIQGITELRAAIGATLHLLGSTSPWTAEDLERWHAFAGPDAPATYRVLCDRLREILQETPYTPLAPSATIGTSQEADQ